VDPRELGQQKYLQRVVERMLAAIQPDESQGEPPLLPILNRYEPKGTTADVGFKTTRPCFTTTFSHINLVAADTARWEQSAAFRLEQAVLKGSARFYARNDQLGLTIPYDFMGVSHHYEPDYLVRLQSGVTLVLEIKGMETAKDQAKHQAAKRWVEAVNNWGKLGAWAFHVCKDPQMLGQELAYLVKTGCV
jgi:type III restriction enzyme